MSIKNQPSISNNAESKKSAAMSKLITIKDVCDLLKISRPTVYRRTRDPKSGFPRPVHVGENAVRFRLCDVEAYVAALLKD